MEKRGKGERVPVDAFEGNNLIFVDEGHKGSGGEAWRQVRNAIGSTGFTFEYSATFGQALTAARNRDLTTEYGKAIAFDYSYGHFYKDGYGKDFNIINLLRDHDDHSDVLLLASFLTFYEQHSVFRDKVTMMRRYNIEQPLWALVGSSVNAVYSKNRRERSDVLDVICFLHRFLSDRNWAVKNLKNLLLGKSGFEGEDGDLFKGKFNYLRERHEDEIYDDIVDKILNASNAGGLTLCNIKEVDGEIGLKVSGTEQYFGVIYIGDTSKFIKLANTNGKGITVENDVISGSLFGDINRPDTTINILIGSRKFMEGWNSWRISNMGLLNIGRSEGAQIIQLFGRGVRLRGLKRTLKRSASIVATKHPAYIKKLETLNIFALRADYMTKFREYLEREGAEEMIEIHLPTLANGDWLHKGLVLPQLDGRKNFKAEKELILKIDESIRVHLDVTARAQSITSGDDIDVSDGTTGKKRSTLEIRKSLDFVNWNAVYLDVMSYVNERGYDNLATNPRDLRRIMEDGSSYELFADDCLIQPSKWKEIEDFQHAIVTILRKYADRLYRNRRAQWESNHLSYQKLEKNAPNLQFNLELGEQSRSKYIIKVPVSQKQIEAEIQRLAKLGDLYKFDGDNPPRIYFDRHLYQPLLIEKTEVIKTFPPSLNKNEVAFVKDLRTYYTNVLSKERTEIFLLRNLSMGRGVGFFENYGFFPDFIIWIKDEDVQRIVFVEPHGMLHAPAYLQDDKAQLHIKLRHLAREINTPPDISCIMLDSFIVSTTPFQRLKRHYDDGTWDLQKFADRHILFQEQEVCNSYDYIEEIFRRIDRIHSPRK